MNPLQWKREYQIAWILVGAFGGIVRLLFAWFESPARQVVAAILGVTQAHAFLLWLPLVGSYWHLPTFGFVIAGLVFYVLMLFRRT
jgi:hypothetical protein